MSIPPAPATFEGTLSELYQRHIERVLPSREAVLQFHDWMCRYVDSESDDDNEQVFPLRGVTGTVRRELLETEDGTRIAAADNSPAWVVHALLVADAGSHPVRLANWDDFKRLMTRDMATHMFDVPKCVSWSANTFGWYVAHILPAKNRNTNWRSWDRAEVSRRFFRTLHPCNLFFVPGVRNRELGENLSVIAFMASRFQERYGAELWQDFVRRSLEYVPPASAQPATDNGSMLVRLRESETLPVSPAEVLPSDAEDVAPAMVRYSATRLTFKRDVIEPLPDNGLFQVDTPFGKFRFTKRQFYTDFPNIPATRSYRDAGIYHGASLHMQALHRRVSG